MVISSGDLCPIILLHMFHKTRNVSVSRCATHTDTDVWMGDEEEDGRILLRSEGHRQIRTGKLVKNARSDTYIYSGLYNHSECFISVIQKDARFEDIVSQ